MMQIISFKLNDLVFAVHKNTLFTYYKRSDFTIHYANTKIRKLGKLPIK